ncbi:hypothetical protein [Clostridium beijerinckii]|jgi:hypothetical protein|nr:hypothetical protein [Clostridium beijerinckii]NRT22552.1 hypothetical protein [Clostridium beijerinckii]NRT64932.1 hypothetical protein [Clostridium beijerinckii]NRU49884.1 hypothetical protein [Clostridium beijerinckii]NRZ32117.1 hypothetical protein [Clostridium beijerinckii]NSA11332.1 hypothetical protein [Clostridium beijerinckii]
MRQNFSNLYNLVTIQCDYFGSEFMQNNLPLNLSKDSINILNNFDLFMNDNVINFDKSKNIREQISLTATASISESPENFNDMSYMQSIDNITAV